MGLPKNTRSPGSSELWEGGVDGDRGGARRGRQVAGQRHRARVADLGTEPFELVQLALDLALALGDAGDFLVLGGLGALDLGDGGLVDLLFGPGGGQQVAVL